MKFKLHPLITFWMYTKLRQCPARRGPDFVIGGQANPYLLRWWMVFWRRWSHALADDKRKAAKAARWFLGWLPGAYLHLFLRSDDDRALHDHPWGNCSIVLHGEYTEHTIEQGGCHHKRIYRAGDVVIRWSGTRAHRIELHAGPVWTLFLHGPITREWGFHCPDRGWVHWKKFTAANDAGQIGKGCAA